MDLQAGFSGMVRDISEVASIPLLGWFIVGLVVTDLRLADRGPRF
jgi:hypothetical protein